MRRKFPRGASRRRPPTTGVVVDDPPVASASDDGAGVAALDAFTVGSVWQRFRLIFPVLCGRWRVSPPPAAGRVPRRMVPVLHPLRGGASTVGVVRMVDDRPPVPIRTDRMHTFWSSVVRPRPIARGVAGLAAGGPRRRQQRAAAGMVQGSVSTKNGPLARRLYPSKPWNRATARRISGRRCVRERWTSTGADGGSVHSGAAVAYLRRAACLLHGFIRGGCALAGLWEAIRLPDRRNKSRFSDRYVVLENSTQRTSHDPAEQSEAGGAVSKEIQPLHERTEKDAEAKAEDVEVEAF